MEFTPDPFIETIGLFVRANCNDQCDFCETPQNGSYSRPSGCYEYPDEVDYAICGKCIVDNQKRNNGRFNDFDLPEIILPF